MTEICGGITCTAPNELTECSNSSGRIIMGCQIKIINQRTGEKCGIGEEGEIYLKVPIPPMGYYKDEMATRNAFDNEGYFISGDLGYFDESGRLTVVGRKKEVFKCRGFFVFPTEIEHLILKHSDVRDVCVVNVYDDEMATDIPAAVVVKMENSSITADDVYAIIIAGTHF